MCVHSESGAGWGVPAGPNGGRRWGHSRGSGGHCAPIARWRWKFSRLCIYCLEEVTSGAVLECSNPFCSWKQSVVILGTPYLRSFVVLLRRFSRRSPPGGHCARRTITVSVHASGAIQERLVKACCSHRGLSGVFARCVAARVVWGLCFRKVAGPASGSTKIPKASGIYKTGPVCLRGYPVP